MNNDTVPASNPIDNTNLDLNLTTPVPVTSAAPQPAADLSATLPPLPPLPPLSLPNQQPAENFPVPTAPVAPTTPPAPVFEPPVEPLPTMPVEPVFQQPQQITPQPVPANPLAENPDEVKSPGM